MIKMKIIIKTYRKNLQIMPFKIIRNFIITTNDKP